MLEYLNEFKGYFDPYVEFYYKSVEPFWYVYIIGVFFFLYLRHRKGKELFGIKIDLGAFGAGKTYNIFKQALIYKWKYGAYIISNNPYYFTDLHFNSTEDLGKVFDFMVQYFQRTNKEEYLKMDRFRPIVFILDESHLYFFSRNAMKNLKDDNIMVSVSQCRKRSILKRFITQELPQLDSTFRRLVPNVRKFYQGFFGISFWREYYFEKDDTDVKNEEVAKVVARGFFLTPGGLLWTIKNKISKKFEGYHSQKWVSKYIVGLQLEEGKNLLDDYTYDEFEQGIYGPKGIKVMLEYKKPIPFYKRLFNKIVKK